VAPVEIGAMSYMMSRQQHLSDQDKRWHPHLMFYTPNTITSSDWGANLPDSPVLGGGIPLTGGDLEPVMIYLVPVGHWSGGLRPPGTTVADPVMTLRRQGRRATPPRTSTLLEE